MRVSVNDKQITLTAPVTVLLDRGASTEDVLAAEAFVSERSGTVASLHYLPRSRIAVIPAPPGARKAQKRYAHGGGAIKRPANKRR